MKRLARNVVFCAILTALTFSVAFALDPKTGAPTVGKQSQIVQPPPTKPLTPKPGVAYAGVSLSCSGKTYNLSTGNSSGECKVHYDCPTCTRPTGASCTDGKGNSSSATCEGCNGSKGSGSCTRQ